VKYRRIYNGFSCILIGYGVKCFMRQLARCLNINAATPDFSKSGRLVELKGVHIGIADLRPDIFVSAYRVGNSVRLINP